MDSTSLFTSRKGLILLLLFASLSFTVLGAEAQSNNGTSTSPPTNSTAPPPTNSTATNQGGQNATATPDPTDVGNFEPDSSSFIIGQFTNATGTYINLLNNDTVRTHFANGTAVPSAQMGGEVVEVEEVVQVEATVTTISHTDVLPDPVQPVTPEIFQVCHKDGIEIPCPEDQDEPHPNNPDGLPARDLINERSFDTEIEETKLADGTIIGTYTSGMTPMILDYVAENEEEVWTFFKTSYSDGGFFGDETMTVSSPKTSYVYHYPTGSITLFTAGQVLGDSQPVAVESWTIHQALWGEDAWTQLELNNASVQTVIEEDADGITISAIKTNDNGIFKVDYVLTAGEELETFVSFTNNNPAWDGVPNLEAKSHLVTPAILYRAGIPEVPEVPSIYFAGNDTTRPAIPAVPAVPAQQGVAAVYSEPSWILSGTPFKFGFVQSIDSITLTTDEYEGYTEFKDVSNVLTFTDHLGIDIRYDFKDSKSELWSVNVDENGLISMDFRYAKGVVNFGETKGIDPSWEWTTTNNSYYADAQGHGKSDVTTTVDAPTLCPDGTGDGAVGTADHTDQGRIAEHPTTQTDPSCSFEAIEFDVSGLPSDAVITGKDLIFDVDMVIPAATPVGWTQSPATSGTEQQAVTIGTANGGKIKLTDTNDLDSDCCISFGLLHVDTPPSSSNTYQDPEFSFHITHADNTIYESGSNIGNPDSSTDWEATDDVWEIEMLTDGTVKYYRNDVLKHTSAVTASGEYYVYISLDSANNYIEYVAYDQGNTGTYTQMFPQHWDIANALETTVDSYGKVTKTTSNGWNSYIFSGSVDVATTGGDKITIDVDTATATYDNPTNADWQRKSLTSALDESSCDNESPCGFKTTAEINVSALGDGTQVVVLQDDTDAPQESTEATAYGEPNSDYDGTNSGANTGQTGKFGDAWDFDGNDGNNMGDHDYVDVPALGGDTDVGSTIRSVSVWAKQNGGDDDNWFLTFGDNDASSGGNDFFAMQADYGGFNTRIRDGVNSYYWECYNCGGIDFSLNGWHHLVVTYGTEVKVYVDGTNVPSNTWANSNDVTKWIDSDMETLTIGSSGGEYGGQPNYTKSFNGLLDQVLLYSDELTQGEVDLLWNSGNGDTTPDGDNLIAHYDFEQTGNTLENVAPIPTTYDQLDSEDSLALTVDAAGNAMISARDPAVAWTTPFIAASPIDNPQTSGANDDEQISNQIGLYGVRDSVGILLSNSHPAVGETVNQIQFLLLRASCAAASGQSCPQGGTEISEGLLYAQVRSNNGMPSGTATVDIATDTAQLVYNFNTTVDAGDVVLGDCTDPIDANCVSENSWTHGTNDMEQFIVTFGDGTDGGYTLQGGDSIWVFYDQAASQEVGHPPNSAIMVTGYRDGGSDLTCSTGGNDCQEKTEHSSSWGLNDHETLWYKLGNPAVSAGGESTNVGDWNHSDAAHTLDVGTDYVAEISRGNIGAGADGAFIDYDNPTSTSNPIVWTDCTDVTINGDNSLTGAGANPPWYESGCVSTDPISVGDSVTFLTDAVDTSFGLDSSADADNLTSGSTRNHPQFSITPQYPTANVGGYQGTSTYAPDVQYGLTCANGTANCDEHVWRIDYVSEGAGGFQAYRDDVLAYTSSYSPSGDYYIHIAWESNSHTSSATLPDVITYPYVDPKDIATLRILDDGNQVGATVHLDVSDIQGLDNVFLAGAIPTKAGHDSTTKDINIYGAGVTTEETASVTTTGLLGLYKFDDTSGDYVNSAGTLGSTETLFPDFTYEAGSYSQTGVIGDSVHMNGRSGDSNVNFDWNGEDWTVSVWCSLDSGVSDYYRGCIGNRFGASDGNPSTTAWWTLGTYASGGQWFIETSGGDIKYDGIADTDATGDGFHHFVLVHDASGSTSGGLTNGELRVYKDGILVDTLYYGKHGGTQTFEVGTTGNYLAIGKWSYSGTGSTDWVGNIDSLMIWNHAIDGGDGSDTTKIGQLYDSGSGTETITEDSNVTTYPTTPSWQSEFDNAIANGRNCDVVELGIQPSAQTEYNALYTGIKDGADVLIENNDFCARNNDETISVATSYNERLTEDYYAIGIRHDGLGVKLTDETTGSQSLPDTLGTNADLTIAGDPVLSTGVIGSYAMDFDGSGDLLDTPTAHKSDLKFLHDGSDWSLSFWLKADDSTIGNDAALMGTSTSDNYNGLYMKYADDTNDNVYIRTHNGGTQPIYCDAAGWLLDDGAWHHYVVTHKYPTLTTMRDGGNDWTCTAQNNNYDTGDPEDVLRIAARHTDSHYASMELDDLAIWNTDIGSDGAATLWASGTGAEATEIPDGLKAYWNFEEIVSSTTVPNITSYSVITPATFSDRDSTHWHADVEAELEITYTIPPPYLPNAPTNFDQDESNLQQGQVDLTWTDPTILTEEIPVDRYNIYKSEFVYAKRQLADNQGTDPFLFNICGQSGEASCQQDMSDNTLLMHLNDMFTTVTGTTTAAFDVSNLLAYYDFNEDATFTYDPLDFVQNGVIPITTSSIAYETDFSGSTGWTITNTDGSTTAGSDSAGNTDQAFSIADNRLYWNVKSASSNSGSQAVYDLTSIDDDEWVLQYILKVSGRAENHNQGAMVAVGLFSDSGASGAQNQSGGTYSPLQDYARVMVYAQGGTALYGIASEDCGDLWGCDGNQISHMNIASVDGTKTWYIQMIKTANQVITATAGTDGFGGTVDGSSVTTATGADTNDVRYLKVEAMNFDNAAGTNRVHGYISDLTFCDGATTCGSTTTFNPNPDAWITGIDGAAFDTQEVESAFTPANPTPTFEDDFSTDTWTGAGNSGTPTTVTISDGDLSAVSVDVTGDDRMYKDLGFTLSDTAWVLQFDTNVSSSGSGEVILAGLVDGTGNLNGESILVHYNGGAIIMREYNNSALTEVGSGISISTGTQYYVTVIRTALDGLTLEVRTGSHTGTLVGSESGTITGSIDLDTIQSGAYGRGSGTATYDTDNIIIHDGVTSCNPCSDTPAVIYDSNLTTSASPVDWADDSWSVSAWTKQSAAGLPVSADGWAVGQATGAYGSSTQSLVGYDMGGVTLNQYVDFASYDDRPFTAIWNPDGTKMYMLSYMDQQVDQFDAATAWDISTLTHVSNWGTSGEISPSGYWLSPDGLNAYVCGKNGNDINQYSLSTAWDSNSGSHVRDQGDSWSSVYGCMLSPDGTKMYISDKGADRIWQYELSTAWDISTLGSKYGLDEQRGRARKVE